MTPPIVVMDVGDVLITTTPMAQYRAIAQQVDLTWQQVADRIENSGVVAAFERGALDEDQFGDQIRHLLRRPDLPIGTIHQAWNRVIAEVEPIVAGAAAELAVQARLILASNTNPIHWRLVRARLRRSGIDVPAVLSFEVSASKPDAAFFAAFRRAHPYLGEAVYVDDRADNMAAATRAGLLGWLHRDPVETATRLRKLLA